MRAGLPWSSAIQVRPIAPAEKAPATETAPELDAELAPPQGDLVPRRTGPLRPRPPAPANVTEPPPANTAPNLSPQLSAQDLASAQQQTNDSLRVAEQNLQRTKGKSLTALQSDLVSKVSGFVRDARSAAGEGDWISARNLAKKAQVLSEELVGIL